MSASEVIALRTMRARITALVIGAVLGGAIGAVAGADGRPAGENAEASVGVNAQWPEVTDRPELRAARLKYLEQVSRSRPVIEAAARQAGRDPRAVADSTAVHVAADGSLRVDTRADDTDLATGQATAVALQTVSAAVFGLRSTTSRVALVGDFEGGNGLWTPEPSASGFPVAALRALQDGTAHRGQGFLRVSCRAAAGCGIRADVSAYYRKGRTYQVTAWLRSNSPRSQVRILAGTPGIDSVASADARLGPAWRRVVARWTPMISTSIATVVIEPTAAGSVDVDAVTVLGAVGTPRPAIPSGLNPAAEARASDVGRYATVQGGRSTGRSGRAPLLATLAGLAGGAALILSAMAGATMARHRRVESVP